MGLLVLVFPWEEEEEEDHQLKRKIAVFPWGSVMVNKSEVPQTRFFPIIVATMANHMIFQGPS
jgi:hypothetical protein